MESFSTYIFIAVIMSGVGYIATHIRNFNIWKMGLLMFVAAPIVLNLKDTGPAIWVAVIFFFAGFMLPHARIFDGFFESISELINGIRYRDERRDIESQKEELRRKAEELRRREAELERLRRQYEEAMHRARQSRSSSNKPGGDRKQKKQKQYDEKRSGHGAKTTNPQRAKHLETLGLDPNKIYSAKEIIKSYRKAVSECHPDQFQDKSEDEIRKLNEKLRKIIEAADWLKKNPDE